MLFRSLQPRLHHLRRSYRLRGQYAIPPLPPVSTNLTTPQRKFSCTCVTAGNLSASYGLTTSTVRSSLLCKEQKGEADALVYAANLVLTQTIERLFHTPSKSYAQADRGVFLIRGENVVLLGEIVRSPFLMLAGTRTNDERWTGPRPRRRSSRLPLPPPDRKSVV